MFLYLPVLRFTPWYCPQFLLLARYVPNVKRSTWGVHDIIDDRRPTDLASLKISNGHISATDHPIQFMFGSMVGFSGSVDLMALHWSTVTVSWVCPNVLLCRSARVFMLSFEYLHIYSPKSGDLAEKVAKLHYLMCCQRSDLRKNLKYSQSRDLEGIQWILGIYRHRPSFTSAVYTCDSSLSHVNDITCV